MVGDALDAEVLLGASWIVRGGEDEGAEGLLPSRGLLADDGGHGGSGEQTVLPHHHAAHSIGGSHLHNHLLNGDAATVQKMNTGRSNNARNARRKRTQIG